MDFKNGLPGLDSTLFNTVKTHQAFSLTNEEGVSNKKPCVTMHSSSIIFTKFIYFKFCSFLFCGCLEPFLSHC